MQEISVSELKKKIENKETMLVSFSTDWCGPCKMLKEELNKIQSQTPIYRINAEEDTDFSRTLGIRSVPTMKMFKEGSVINTTVGLRSAPEINKLITESVL
jgi:thioredoxin 1